MSRSLKTTAKTRARRSRHSHSQIIAIPFIPKRSIHEIRVARDYYDHTGRSLLLDEMEEELKAKERLVYENGGFAAVCPYASFFPFEIRVAPRFRCYDFADWRKASSKSWPKRCSFA